ncbi:MAG: flavodoxin [Clostridiales Family XIII bacterium]|jgi:flavodoxin|nr:flavodoxin [Clostridiales Family XIII bacterium]
MNVSIRYYSRSGNTKKLAEAIGDYLEVPALPVSEKLVGPTDLLFLGGALYAGGIDSSLTEFINGLFAADVKKVAIFTTSAISKSAYPKIKALLEAKGIKVAEKNFHCPGKFLCLHTKHPDEQDCKTVSRFAAALTMDMSDTVK